MNRVYVTLDLEEWYHLDYLDTEACRATGVQVVPRIFDFLDLLDDFGAKATFFCVGEIADQYADILREILRRGHVIGCHGWDHSLLTDKTTEAFVSETRRAKAAIEAAAETQVTGYRASCFTMDREKLDELPALGFTFDSSKIRFAQHPLYRNLDLTGFEQAQDLVCVKDGFWEYEIPTLDILGRSIPISGGGYLRLFPLWLLKLLLRRYFVDHENFTIYVHPFELTDLPLPLPPGTSPLTRFRCLVGRRRNLKKLRRLLGWLAGQGAMFEAMETRQQATGNRQQGVMAEV